MASGLDFVDFAPQTTLASETAPYVPRLQGPAEPGGGLACEADVYLRGRVRLVRPNSAAVLPRQTAVLWEGRADRQQACTFSTPQEIDSYIAWCLTNGVAGGGIGTELFDPEFWEELDAPGGLSGFCDDLPIMRGVWILYPRSGRNDAAIPVSGERRSRGELALWFVLDAPQKFGWPPAQAARLRGYGAMPLASMSVGGVPMPRLLQQLWDTREDLRVAFDVTSNHGRLDLLRWFLFIGMEEHGFSEADLPDYLRQALRPSSVDPANELPLMVMSRREVWELGG